MMHSKSCLIILVRSCPHVGHLEKVVVAEGSRILIHESAKRTLLFQLEG